MAPLPLGYPLQLLKCSTLPNIMARQRQHTIDNYRRLKYITILYVMKKEIQMSRLNGSFTYAGNLFFSACCAQPGAQWKRELYQTTGENQLF